MSVQVLEFSGRRIAQASARHELHSDLFLAAEPRLHTWTGDSGRRYVLSVNSLFGCGEVIDAVYILATRNVDGTRTARAVSVTESLVGSLNLADIRQAGAQLDADEVHVFKPRTARELEDVRADLATVAVAQKTAAVAC
jgi:hypothetical protein